VSARGTETPLEYRQALRYAKELRELYQRERARADELEKAKAALERNQAELEVLHVIDLSVLGVVPIEETLGTAEASLATLMGADRTSFLLYDSERDRLSPFPATGARWGAAPEIVPEGALREAIERRAPLPTMLSAASGPGLDHLFAAGLRSAILFPLVADSGVLGIFTLASFRPGFCSPQNIEIGERIGAQMTVALRARELAEREQQRTAELEAVRVVSEAVGASLELSEVLDAAMNHATRLTGIPGATVRMVDDETGDLVLTAHRNVPEVIQRLERIPRHSPLGRLLLDDGGPHLVRDAFADDRLSIRAELEAAGIHGVSTVHAPMVWEGRTIGVISLASLDGREVTQADLSLLTAISRPIAAAVGNARLYQTLLQMDATRRRLLARLVRAQEEERQTIASDIHDDSIQVMTAVGMRLYSLRKRLTDEDQLAAVDEFARSITEATRRLRSLMFELRPPALDREGLGAALRLYIDQTTEEDGPTYDLDDRLVVEPSPEIRAVVYRIVQEALTNIRKHARARRVEILVESSEGGVRVRIRDDGVGLPPGQSDQSAPGHMGLNAMRERAEMAAGWWRIESAPARGTVVEFWVPGDPDAGAQADGSDPEA
jgi:signal transduction histidine kinase